MTDQVKEAITKFFSQEIKGKAHKTLLIPVPAAKGEVTITFEKLAEDNQEGSFQETRKNNASSIMVAHGVSPAIIGVHDTASLGSGKGLSQAEIYKDRIVGPIQRRFAKVFTQLFRTGLGLKMVAIKFSPLDIRDLEGEMRTLTGYAKVGAMTVNRMISRAGLGDPLEGGDRPFIIVPGMGVAFLDELEKTAKLGQDAMMARNTKPPGSGGEDKIAGTAPSPNENSKKGGAP